MKIELELWQFITLTTMILGAFWGIAKMMLAQSAKSLDEKFNAIHQRLTTQDESDRRLERDLTDLRVELPRDYVRREDFTRVIASFQVTVDNLRLTIERMLLEGKNRG